MKLLRRDTRRLHGWNLLIDLPARVRWIGTRDTPAVIKYSRALINVDVSLATFYYCGHANHLDTSGHLIYPTDAALALVVGRPVFEDAFQCHSTLQFSSSAIHTVGGPDFTKPAENPRLREPFSCSVTATSSSRLLRF
jgi:hypothetical protein